MTAEDERVVTLYEWWSKSDKATKWRARLAKSFDESMLNPETAGLPQA